MKKYTLFLLGFILWAQPVLAISSFTISEVTIDQITQSGARISWSSNQVANAEVKYGLTTSYGNTLTGDAGFTTGDHHISLYGLSAGTIYQLQVTSHAADGSVATSQNYSFATANKTEKSNTYGAYDVYPPHTTISSEGYVFFTPQVSWNLENYVSKNPITLILACDDGGTTASCASTSYCIDSTNECVPTTMYATPVINKIEGKSYIRYFSTDKSGNKEAVQNQVMLIRTPVVTPSENNSTQTQSTTSVLTLNIPADFQFATPLKLNQISQDIYYLQKILNLDPDTQIATVGAGSPGNETSRFGQLTKSAVIKFQTKYASEVLTPLGLKQATGSVGLYTIKKLNAILSLYR